MEQIHEIQREILRQLQYSERLSFSDMKPDKEQLRSTLKKPFGGIDDYKFALLQLNKHDSEISFKEILEQSDDFCKLQTGAASTTTALLTHTSSRCFSVITLPRYYILYIYCNLTLPTRHPSQKPGKPFWIEVYCRIS